MPKLKIVHKGLILVAIPLIFGICYISGLFVGLMDASRLLDREFLLKDAMISHLSTMASGICGNVGQQMYDGTRDPSWKKYWVSQQKRAIASDRHLRVLLKNDRDLKIPPLSVTFNTIRTRLDHKAETPLMRELQRMSGAESRAADHAIDSLRWMLWGGVSIGIFISLALAVFFCLSITNRLLIIVNNALSLSHGTALNPPFQGNDEIAELDKFLYKSAMEIRDLERFKKEMVGVVSHELKSPLSSVGSFLSTMGAGVYGELSPKAEEKVTRTYKSVKRLMGLVGELLYLDRLELEMNPEEIQLDELLAVSVDAVKELSEKSEIEIKVKSGGGKLVADRNRLVQVIVNLLSNAMKYSPPQGQVTLLAELKDGWFECRVNDQGPGIPESFRKQIFDPFKQVDATDTTSKRGTGLGLTISRSIVQQHGGQIGVESELGKGSTFWFRLPDQSSADSARSATVSGAAGLQGAAKSSVLQSSPVRSMNMGLQAGKFGVLKQGLVIIALPLLFQFSFALLFSGMLERTCKQTEQEQNSMKVLHALNNCANSFASSLSQAVTYVYIQTPRLSKVWEIGKSQIFLSLDDAIHLSSANPEQVKDLADLKKQLQDFSAVFEKEFRTHESKAAFDKLDYAFRKLVYSFNGIQLEPANAEEAAEAEQGLSPIKMLGAFREFSHDPLHQNLTPFVRIQAYLDRTMDREKDFSQQLARQRSEMISTMKLTLICGILATVVISVLIALFLMRNLTSHLQHVMLNTQRLVNRQELEPPIKGQDEIAYLDQIIFETGNHLIELEAFKRELVSIVSHELRTPLLSISSALELFGTGMLGEFSEKGQNRLNFARAEADRLIRLINDLLDIEKMEAGKFILDFSEIKVADLFATAIAAVAQLAEANHINLEVNVDQNAVFVADRDRICQVLINLLSNAIKYSPERGTITMSAQQLDDGRFKCSVSDHGRGVPEELRAQVFDRFVQVEKNDATVRGGTGLGLAICKAIIAQHSGQIGVESELGVGSTFWFTIPISQITALPDK